MHNMISLLSSKLLLLLPTLGQPVAGTGPINMKYVTLAFRTLGYIHG